VPTLFFANAFKPGYSTFALTAFSTYRQFRREIVENQIGHHLSPRPPTFGRIVFHLPPDLLRFRKMQLSLIAFLVPLLALCANASPLEKREECNVFRDRPGGACDIYEDAVRLCRNPRPGDACPCNLFNGEVRRLFNCNFQCILENRNCCNKFNDDCL
jgi:hypothetical protein